MTRKTNVQYMYPDGITVYPIPHPRCCTVITAPSTDVERTVSFVGYYCCQGTLLPTGNAALCVLFYVQDIVCIVYETMILRK